MISGDTKPLVTEYLVREIGKWPAVKKISLLQPDDEHGIDLVITMSRLENPAELHQHRTTALDRLKAEKGLDVDVGLVKMAIVLAETNAYVGHLAGAALQPIEGFHFDPSQSRVLFRNPPKEEKKKKVEKYDPQWAEAKKLCRLNQEEIRMAKELGMKPRSLMKNIPSPKQQWKLPVKMWIRELYEKRHPGKGFRPEPGPQPEPSHQRVPRHEPIFTDDDLPF